MIRGSARFQPLLLGYVPPNWFLVRPGERGELERLLAELGFVPGGSYRLAAPPAQTEEEPLALSRGRRRKSRRD
jgi:hypothetical protein